MSHELCFCLFSVFRCSIAVQICRQSLYNKLHRKKTDSKKGKTKGDKHYAVTLRFTLLSLVSLLVNDHLLIHGLSVYLH